MTSIVRALSAKFEAAAVAAAESDDTIRRRGTTASKLRTQMSGEFVAGTTPAGTATAGTGSVVNRLPSCTENLHSHNDDFASPEEHQGGTEQEPPSTCHADVAGTLGAGKSAQDDEAGQSVLLGVSCGWLAAFCDANELWDHTTAQVVKDIVLPKTKAASCRFVELEGEFGPDQLGPPDVLISHSWAGRFGDLVAAANHNSAATRKVWVDIFAVHQHVNEKMAGDLKRLQDVIRNTPTGTMMVVNPTSAKAHPKTNPLARIWCMYEVWQTVISNQPLVVRIGGMSAEASTEKGGLTRDPKCRIFLEEWRKETVEMLTRKASVVAAESGWPEDKVEILAAIRASDGGTMAVDKTIVSGLWAAYTTRGLPAFEFALQGDAVLKEKLDAGMDLERKNPEGWTPLHCAASEGFPRVIERLLAFGADIEAVTGKGRTAVHQAAWNHRVEALQVLFRNSANPKARDHHRNDAMHYAKTGNNGLPALLDQAMRAKTIDILATHGLNPTYTPKGRGRGRSKSPRPGGGGRSPRPGARSAADGSWRRGGSGAGGGSAGRGRGRGQPAGKRHISQLSPDSTAAPSAARGGGSGGGGVGGGGGDDGWITVTK